MVCSDVLHMSGCNRRETFLQRTESQGNSE